MGCNQEFWAVGLDDVSLEDVNQHKSIYIYICIYVNVYIHEHMFLYLSLAAPQARNDCSLAHPRQQPGPRVATHPGVGASKGDATRNVNVQVLRSANPQIGLNS